MILETNTRVKCHREAGNVGKNETIEDNERRDTHQKYTFSFEKIEEMRLRQNDQKLKATLSFFQTQRSFAGCARSG